MLMPIIRTRTQSMIRSHLTSSLKGGGIKTLKYKKQNGTCGIRVANTNVYGKKTRYNRSHKKNMSIN